MEDHFSPLSWAYFYQDEEIEESRHCLLYITELEATIVSAKEEITRKEFEIDHLKDLLTKTVEERNKARLECQKLMLEKLELRQQLMLKNLQKESQILQNQKQLHEETQFLKQEAPPPLSGTSSSEDCDSNNQITIVSSQFSDPIPHQQPALNSELPEVILRSAAKRPLPEKGKLLQAVKEAGPLLQTLLLAGPLPQWQHPPPQLDSIEIPPATIASPTARLFHQDSFNSHSACLSKKRVLQLSECLDSSSSPNDKHQKI